LRLVSSGGKTDKGGLHILKQAQPRALDDAASGDENIVMAGRSVKRQKMAGRFTQASLRPISLYGAADLARRCEAHANPRPIIAA
jgi:hypothetical protein